jgi:hypothetical protein
MDLQYALLCNLRHETAKAFGFRFAVAAAGHLSVVFAEDRRCDELCESEWLGFRRRTMCLRFVEVNG